MNKEKKSCCVFGHRKLTGKEELKGKLFEIFENLIVFENVDTFYVGSKASLTSYAVRFLLSKRKNIPTLKEFTFVQNTPI